MWIYLDRLSWRDVLRRWRLRAVDSMSNVRKTWACCKKRFNSSVPRRFAVMVQRLLRFRRKSSFSVAWKNFETSDWANHSVKRVLLRGWLQWVSTSVKECPSNAYQTHRCSYVWDHHWATEMRSFRFSLLDNAVESRKHQEPFWHQLHLDEELRGLAVFNSFQQAHLTSTEKYSCEQSQYAIQWVTNKGVYRLYDP